MSSLIAKQPKDTRKQTTVSLKGSVVADLELYCQFIDSARDWVINEALKSVFSKDKAFLEWKERGGQASTNGNGVVHAMSPAERPVPERPRPLRPAASDTNKSA
jgi:hypothetical protein